MSDRSLSYKRQRATAARWMYDRRERVDWWRWSVLTEANPDHEGLRIPAREAVLIFADLVASGLLVPVQASDGSDAFTINPGRDAEWRKVIHPRFTLFTGYGLTVLGWVLSALVGALVTMLAG